MTRPVGIGRNTVRGPNIVQFDLRYTRTVFTLKERIRAQFITEATNIFNHPNVTTLNTTIPKSQLNLTGTAATNPNYGTIIGAVPTSFPLTSTVLQGRILDFGLGVRW